MNVKVFRKNAREYIVYFAFTDKGKEFYGAGNAWARECLDVDIAKTIEFAYEALSIKAKENNLTVNQLICDF